MRHFMLIGWAMLLTTFVTAAAFSALLDDNVVLYLPFDEDKGQVAKDQSKFGNDGEIRNAKWVEGKYGSALEFNGTDAEVRVPDNDSFDLSEITLEVWYNPGDEGVGPGWKVVINKAYNEWYLYLQDSQPLFFINAPEGCPGNNVYWSPAGVRMDEIRISNIARKEDEIKASMEVGLTAVQPSGKMATTWSQIKTR